MEFCGENLGLCEKLPDKCPFSESAAPVVIKLSRFFCKRINCLVTIVSQHKRYRSKPNSPNYFLLVATIESQLHFPFAVYEAWLPGGFACRGSAIGMGNYLALFSLYWFESNRFLVAFFFYIYNIARKTSNYKKGKYLQKLNNMK